MKQRLHTVQKNAALQLGLALVAISAAGCMVGDFEDDIRSLPEPPAAESVETNESAASEIEEPPFVWETDAPENHQMDGALLRELHEAAAETELYSAVTIKDGVLIDEYYGAGYDADSVFRLASCSKTFTGALVGLAIEQGLISGVDAKLSEFLPQIAQSGDALQQQITIGHLLTHTSGIEWYEWNGGNTFGEFVRSENWVDFILGRQMLDEPGTTFAYTTGGSHLLAAALQAATGKTALEFGQEFLFEPLDMDSVQWRADPQGITDGGNGISMTARDAAKFGQLYLQGGRWQGAQILPQSWVEQSVQVQHARSGNSGSYGYQWWLRPFGAAGYETYYAMGHGGQYIFVVPELALVTVMTGHFSADTYAPWPYFENYILAAYTGDAHSAEDSPALAQSGEEAPPSASQSLPEEGQQVSA